MKFVGNYVQNIKLACIASAVSGHNLMLISQPGWGKTDMVRDAAAAIAGGDGTIYLELDPSTPPDTVKGAYDPAKLLEGQLCRIVTGTPYDPAARVVILDEFWRSSDVIADALIHATNQKAIDQTTRPVFWGTANFVGKAERTEALRDRFAMWYHLEPELNVRGIVAAHLNNGTGHDPDFTQGLPSWDVCLDIRRLTPGKTALDLIENRLNVLAVEAQKEGFVINPRRIVQWAEIAFRYSAYVNGTNDFSTLPLNLGTILQWCYPTTDKATAKKWAAVCASIIDQVGSALEAYKAESYKLFQQTAAASSSSNIQDLIMKMGGCLTKAQQEICGLVNVDYSHYRNHMDPTDPENPLVKLDPRIMATLATITDWFTKAINHQPLD